jgi:Tfp pilus assembly protein PilF
MDHMQTPQTSTASVPAGQVTMTHPKRFTVRHLRGALVLLAITYAFIAGLHTIGDFDTGWHLATGRWVLAHRAIPGTDVLSYTSPGTSWHYPPFAGVLLYTIFSIWGYAGLSWLCATACAAVVAYLALRTPSAGVAPLLATLAVPSLVYRITPRADLFTTIFFAVLLTELWRFHRGLTTRLWTLPLLMLLWVNLHPGFIAGLGLFIAYLLMEALEMPFPAQRKDARARLRRMWPWLAATFAMILANPWGWRLFESSITLASRAGHDTQFDFRGFIGEWSAMALSWRSLLRAFSLRDPDSSFWWLVALAVVLVIIALWRRQFGAAVLVGAAIYASMERLRLQGLFAVTVVVIGSTILEDSWKWISSHQSARSSRWSHWCAAAILTAVSATTAVRIVDLISDRLYITANAIVDFGVGESWWFPERAAAFIEREHLPGNIFQPFNLGGFTALRLGPNYPDYTDGRSVSAEVFAEERRLLTEAPDSSTWQEISNRRNINFVMLSLARIGGLELTDIASFCRSSVWRPVYMDEVSVVLLRQRPENRPWIDRLQIDCQSVQFQPPPAPNRNQLFQFYANSGAVLYMLSRGPEAEQAWSRALSLEPEDPNVHLDLAQLYQQALHLDQAEQQYKTALALKPTSVAWYALGRMYASEHRYNEAATAIAASADLTATPANNYKALGQVQLKLHQPEFALKALDKAEKTSPFAKGAEQLNPEFYAQLAESRAEAYRQLGHVQKALELQQQAVSLTPEVSSRWYKLSEFAQASGQQQLAEKALRRAQELAQAESQDKVQESRQ